MTDHTISQTVLGTFFLPDGDTLTIAAGAGLVDDDGPGVVGEGSMSVTVNGYINSRNEAVLLEEAMDAETAELIVSETGIVTSDKHAAVDLTADTISIINHGTISTNDITYPNLRLDGEVTLDNTGTISMGGEWGYGHGAIEIIEHGETPELRTHTISNSGVIRDQVGLTISDQYNPPELRDNVLMTNTGEINGVHTALRFDTLGQVEIVNSGIIRSMGDAIYIYLSHSLHIHNTESGEINGTLRFSQTGDTAEIVNEGFISDIRGSGGTNLNNSGTIGGITTFNGSYYSDDILHDVRKDYIYNSGTITGIVSMNDGEDYYKGSATSYVNKVDGGDGDDTLIDGNNDTQFFGDTGNDLLRGKGGNDTLDGQDKKDTLWGGEGDDLLQGGKGDDELHGGAGDDLLWGGEYDDSLRGGDGQDSLYGDYGRDTLVGGEGDDLLSDTRGENVIYGNLGSDTLLGGKGKDRLFGNEGNDQLNGNNGHDKIKGGKGDDVMSGGADSDTFAFGKTSGTDTIVDFTLGEDLIGLSAYGINPADFDTVLAPALSDQTDGAFLDFSLLGGEGGVLLLGVTAGSLGADDFVF